MMRRQSHLLISALLLLPTLTYSYEANWESLDSRPLPDWYDEAKFGIFLHWGVFSVPAFGSEWFWNWWEGARDPRYIQYVESTERPGFSYQEYAQRFDAALYRPDQWASMFADSGAQYIVMTSKHHEGFCNWDSKDVPTTWNWNVMDVGPKRDILGDLAAAVKQTTSPHTAEPLKFGVYHSMFEWYNPAYVQDQRNKFATRDFVTSKCIPELYDLVSKYEPDVIWSDGSWDAHSDYWTSTEFLAWLSTESAVKDTVVWNDRWGNDCMCKHGGFLTCDDRYQPGKLVEKKWENALTIDKTSWGLNRNASYTDYMTTKELIDQLVETVAFNGNMLLNIGPGADGTIHPIFTDRLLGMGKWLKVNGDAIFKSRPWTTCTNEDASHVYYTINEERETLYALVLQWPSDNVLVLEHVVGTESTEVRMLGNGDDDTFDWYQAGGKFNIEVPNMSPAQIPCDHVWVFALTKIGNLGLGNGSIPVLAQA
jgi:alpha-L-fucosidase